jgi:GxxExxY protein
MAPTSTDPRQIRGKNDDLTEKIIGVFYEVYNELGSGFLESVYRGAMQMALAQTGLKVEAEVPIEVRFRGEVVGIFRADLIVNGAVLIELTAMDGLAREHEAQTLHYLKATRIEVALLMNFGPAPRFKRLVMDNEQKTKSVSSVSSVLIGVKPLLAPEVA